jgi:hypothetical protein
LQTLRDAVKDANIEYGGRSRPKPNGAIIFVGEQRIGGDGYVYREYPKGIWWKISLNGEYRYLIGLYINQNEENGEGFGMSLETGYPIEAARSYFLAIIDEALLTATEDTPDYLEPDRSRLYFRNSISLQTLHDRVKNAKTKDVDWNTRGVDMYGTTFSPNFPASPIILVGEQEIGRGNQIRWEYKGIWWRVYAGDRVGDLIREYTFHIEETGKGFGMYLEE